MRVVISGASGLLGTTLSARLEAHGHEVIRLVRRDTHDPAERRWDPAAGRLEASALEGADCVVNLSGAGIGDKRWTEARRREIIDSRLDTTRLLAETMAGMEHPPPLLVSQSAIGYYGDRGDEVLTEDSPAGTDGAFLTDLTSRWEAAADPAREAGIRVIHPRTGLVLAAGTQLLGRLVPLFKLGLGGPIAHGRQWWSWISLDDQVAAMHTLLEGDIDGPVNLVAPNPVRNRMFTEVLGEVLGRPTFLTVPRVGIRLVMGREMADELSLSSTRVKPNRLEALGFSFEHETIEEALRALVG